MRRSSLRPAGLVLLALCSIAGCGPRPPVAGPGEQPYDEVRRLACASDDVDLRSVTGLSQSAYQRRPWLPLGVFPTVPRSLRFEPVLDRLAELVRGLPDTAKVRMVLTFEDTIRIPRFPRLDPRLPREAHPNRLALDSARVLVGRLRQRRESQYVRELGVLEAAGARIVLKFWLVQACVSEMRVDSLRRVLRQLSSIRHLRFDRGAHPPQVPAGACSETDVQAARTWLRTDSYFDAYSQGYIGLLDTGVRTSHEMFTSPDVAIEQTYLVGQMATSNGEAGGGADAAVVEAVESMDTDLGGHGTSSAGILVGDGIVAGGPSPPCSRGITRARLDSFGVFDREGGLLKVGAAILGFERAVERLNQVVVAEMAEYDAPDVGALALAADHVHDAGVIVVAANGNDALGVPASGRRVMGCGAFHVVQSDTSGQNRPAGSTLDGRHKPDISAPTSTVTASNASEVGMHVYRGTSGATPYAAGAALLLHNWISRPWPEGDFTPDPGQTFAFMILSGDKVGPFGDSTPMGAGRLRLPVDGTCWFGKAWLAPGVGRVDVPIELPAGGVNSLTAALWWPERGGTVVDPHNDLDLDLVEPWWWFWGRVRASSHTVSGVFERASVVGEAPLSGTWKVRITARTLRTQGYQPVYWAVHAGNH